MKKVTALLLTSACAFTFVSHSLGMEHSGIMDVEGTLPNTSDHSRSHDASKEKTKSLKNSEKPKISTNQLLQELLQESKKNNTWLQALYQQNAITVQYQLNMQQAQENKSTKSDIADLREKTQSALSNLSKKTDKKIKMIHENKTS